MHATLLLYNKAQAITFLGFIHMHVHVAITCTFYTTGTYRPIVEHA